MNSPQLPAPSATAAAASQALCRIIRTEIQNHGGWIPFSRFMELALYAPQYGYYTGGSHKIGGSGDFITAPTLSPLFGQTLARQLAELLPQTAGNVYEFGAGTGALAATLLQNLSDGLKHYYIIEVSPELAERQRAHIAEAAPEAAGKVTHLSSLPDTFDGIIIGNEVLDAMPIEIVRHAHNQWQQMGVTLADDSSFIQQAQPLPPSALSQAATSYFPHSPQPYTSELHPAQHAFMHTLA